MTVLNPVVETWDGPNRRIYLKQGVTEFYPIEDLYHEYRTERRLNEDFRKYNSLLKAEGNVPKGAGAFTPRYVVLLEGTKIVPYDEPDQLNQLGDIITDDPDTDPTLYDISQLTTAKPIFIKPSEAETIQLNSLAIEYSSFGGGVTLDEANGVAGVDYPIGTPREPVNNLTDAMAIATTNGFGTIFVHGNALIDNGGDYSGMIFVGESQTKTILTITAEANVLNCEFYDAHVDGVLDGNAKLKDCVIEDLTFVTGYIEQCVISPGEIVLGGSADAHFLDCWSGVPGLETPSIDMGGSGQSLSMRNYNGGIKIKNKTGPDKVSIDLNSGQVIIDNTVTAGTIVLRGIGKWTNKEDYTGGATVYDELVDGRDLQEVHKAHFNKRVWDKVEKIITLYEDDGVTILYQFDTNDDMSIITPRGIGDNVLHLGNNVVHLTDNVVTV